MTRPCRRSTRLLSACTSTAPASVETEGSQRASHEAGLTSKIHAVVDANWLRANSANTWAPVKIGCNIDQQISIRAGLVAALAMGRSSSTRSFSAHRPAWPASRLRLRALVGIDRHRGGEAFIVSPPVATPLVRSSVWVPGTRNRRRVHLRSTDCL